METVTAIDTAVTAATEWDEIVKAMRLKMAESTWQRFFIGSRGLEILPGDKPAMRVEVVSKPAREWIEAKFMGRIEDTAYKITGTEYEFVFIERGADGGTEQASMDPEEIRVELSAYDPQDSGFIMVSNYVLTYWQPYLGTMCFLTWLVLRRYAWSCQQSEQWPALPLLSEILGTDRQSMTGRKRGGEWKPGYLEQLEEYGIVKVGTKHGSYIYKVADTLPILTPRQAAKLPDQLQANHLKWMARNRIDIERWKTCNKETYIR